MVTLHRKKAEKERLEDEKKKQEIEEQEQMKLLRVSDIILCKDHLFYLGQFLVSYFNAKFASCLRLCSKR